MKKLLTVALCACALVLGGCGQSGENTATTAAQKATEAKTQPQSTAPTETQTSEFYDESAFSDDENGFKSYSNATTESLAGIDVSSYSGEIDWEKVAAGGVKFAIVRVGGRGYGDEGTIYADDNLYYNIEQAQANGIMVGAYFYSQAVNTAEAEEEADFVISHIAEHNVTLPVAYDFEHIEGDTARTDNVTDKQAAQNADAFCKKLEASGFDAVVYHEYGENTSASHREWVAEYEKTPKLSRNVLMWQYSKDGKIDGIEGSVDLNIMFAEKE